MKKIYNAILIIFSYAVLLQGCGKSNLTANSSGGTKSDTSTTIISPTEPAIASTQGFFLDNWQPKTFIAPSFQQAQKPSVIGPVTVTIDVSKQITKVSDNEYGNNSNPYMGEISTVPALISNITDLAPGIIRFPGGSLSDVYFWNQSTQPPADAPAQLLDLSGNAAAAGYWYGNEVGATWTMTVDDYYSTLQQTKSTGLITVNYGYARYGTSAHPDQVAAHLAADWVRYDNGRTKYWEVGNENYGNWEAGYRINPGINQDGQPQIQDGTTYGTQFQVFADSMRAAALQIGASIKIGIVLTEADDSNSDQGPSNWNAKVLSAAGNMPDFYVVHNYYTPYEQNSSPSVILATPIPGTASMLSWVKSSASGAGVTQKPVAMDEWNIFSTGSSQMVSNVAGVHAVMVLGEALKNQISMTSRWDLANAWDNGDDQGMFNNSSPNSGAEPNAPAWNARPAFYYMYYFQNYIGDHLLTTASTDADIVGYGSSWSSGQAGVILINKGSGDHVVVVNFKNYAAGINYYYYTLNGGKDNAPFSHEVFVNGTGPATNSGGPSNFKTIAARASGVQGGIAVTVPANGAVFLVTDHK